MSYCTAADVRTVVDTALADGEIAGIIETSDAEIDRRIGVQDSSDKLVKKLSMLSQQVLRMYFVNARSSSNG